MAQRNSQFWERCATLTDFELCNRISLAVEDLSGTDLSWPRLVVARLGVFQGFSEKEGLRASVASCFFEGTSLREIAESYDFIGLPEQAEVMWHLSSATDEARQADRKSRGGASMFQSSEDLISFVGDRVDWERYERVIFDQSARFSECLAVFIRGNLEEFEGLEVNCNPIERGLPNTGYLSSMLFWMQSYASEHNGTVPTLSQLREHCMHDGIKGISDITHTILVKGAMPSTEGVPLIRYQRPGARYAYVINFGGSIHKVPTELEPPGGQVS